jgi:GcrA cell cycle regulator
MRRLQRGVCQVCAGPLNSGKIACSRACGYILRSGKLRGREQVHSQRTRDGLRARWEDGMAVSEIGRQLGISKNSVVSLRRRMRLATRGSPIIRDAASDGSPKQAAAPKRPAGSRPRPAVAHPPPPPATIRKPPNLRAGQLPVTLRPPMKVWDGQLDRVRVPVKAGVPGCYCSAHTEIRWHPLTQRCRAAA